MENQLESGEVLGSGFSDFSQPHLPKMYEKPWQLCWLLGITRGLLEVFYPHNILPKETVVACPRFLNILANSGLTLTQEAALESVIFH